MYTDSVCAASDDISSDDDKDDDDGVNGDDDEDDCDDDDDDDSDRNMISYHATELHKWTHWATGKRHRQKNSIVLIGAVRVLALSGLPKMGITLGVTEYQTLKLCSASCLNQYGNHPRCTE